MKFRYLAILMAALVLTTSAAARAADCVEVREVYDAEGRQVFELMLADRSCGPLRIVERRREDPRLEVNIFATYPVFDPARDDAERRYNDWAGRLPERMNFTKPLEVAGANVDTMAGTLYRSPRLLSAHAGGWTCCGAHGMSWARSLNLDVHTGRDVWLGDLVDIARVADRCWQEFSQLEAPIPGQGMLFMQSYPRARFDALLESVVWAVTLRGLHLDFDYLLGFIGAEFVCSIPTADLPQFAKPGVAVPF